MSSYTSLLTFFCQPFSLKTFVCQTIMLHYLLSQHLPLSDNYVTIPSPGDMQHSFFLTNTTVTNMWENPDFLLISFSNDESCQSSFCLPMIPLVTTILSSAHAWTQNRFWEQNLKRNLFKELEQWLVSLKLPIFCDQIFAAFVLENPCENVCVLWWRNV